MKKLFIIILMSIGCLLITGCDNSSPITEINYSELEKLINDKKSFILEIVQTGCSHCEEFSPRFKVILKDNNIEAYSLNLYNLTNEEREKLNKSTTISGTPTVLFFEDGKETSNRIYGDVSNEKIKEHLKKGGYIK